MNEILERAKRRIRGLLNLASDDAASEGEITAAMKLAEREMDRYHLDHADVEASESVGAAPQTERMDTVDSTCRGKNRATWESALYHAISELVGSVGAYGIRGAGTVGAFHAPSNRCGLRWYGPADDARLAADLFDEWSRVISTLAVGRYGGCLRGDGSRYAYGFAASLRENARRAAAARRTVVTLSTTALARREGGSLADVLDRKRADAKAWLASTGIRLGTSGGRRRVILSGGGRDAFASGKADGDRADFSANRTKRLTA